MKPIMILPPGLMSEGDIKELRANGLCVVTAEDPSKVRFVDPIPAASSRTQMENAAIQLSRRLLHGRVNNPNLASYKGNICELYVWLLSQGSALDPDGSNEEREQALFDQEKRDELRRLARIEAKAEHGAAKKKAPQDKT